MGQDQPGSMNTLIDLFNSFESRGDKPAMIFRTGVRRLSFSYHDLHNLAIKMAGWLAERGVGPGDRVLLWAPNSPWWGVAFWGIVTRGAIVVPVDFMSGRERAETINTLTAAKVIIQSRFKVERFAEGACVFLEDLPFLLEQQAELAAPAAATPDDIAQLIYTSGTTGNPKGVILTHRNLVANLLQVNRHVPIVNAEFSFLSLLPLSHIFEQMGGFFTPLYRGSTIIYLRTLKPSAIMEALGDEDVYAINLVPRLLQLLKSSIEREFEAKHLAGVFCRLLALGNRLGLRWRQRLFYPVQKKFGNHFTFFVSGGAPLDPEVMRFWSNMGFVVLEGYGLTECAPVLAANPMERQIVGAVGIPLPGVELKVINNEILARGANIFPGYYRNEAATREAFTSDGWFRTGDLGELDSEGWLRIKGRSKELIVTGAGINVYPDEIEAILNKIAGVRESCVIGLDKGRGEEVHAVLLLDGSGRKPDDIIQEANRQIDLLHQITGVSLWPEPEFPKTTTLKIQKFKVKERMKEGKSADAGVSVDKLVSLIVRVTGTPVQEIREDSLLVAHLGLTSVARLELVNFIEQEFRLDLDDTAIGLTTRVADLRRLIDKREKVESHSRLRLWANSRPVRMVRRLCDALIHYPVISAFVTIERRGVERLAGVREPVMFIANHLSYFDQPVIMLALPKSWRYNTATAAWEEFFFPQDRSLLVKLWRRFTFEYGTLALNLFPLPQSRGFRPALHHMGRLADDATNILVFPEGERSQDGRLLPFQLGLGIMVKELGIPVVPIRISGMERVFPRGAVWPNRGRVTISFGEPLWFRQETPAEIVEQTRRAVEKL